MSLVTVDNVDESTQYPRSFSSVIEGQVSRSRQWNQDITKHWNMLITGLEAFDERAGRYLVYFNLLQGQLQCIYTRILGDINYSLPLEKTLTEQADAGLSIQLINTHVKDKLIPVGTEKGQAFTLTFEGDSASTVCASKVVFNGMHRCTITKVCSNLNKPADNFTNGFRHASVTALSFFDHLSSLIKNLLVTTGTSVESEKPLNLGVSTGFPFEYSSMSQARLLRWTKGYLTGRKTNDPVECMEFDALLDHALSKSNVSAKVAAVLNDSVATLLAVSYEKPSNLPPCRVGIVIGHGINGCFIPSAAQGNSLYKNCIINCEIGNLDKSLPVNDIDLEVDFGDESTEGTQIFEKMVAATYLGELCRRLVVKVWQSEAPQISWVRQSLPWQACARIIETQNEEELDVTKELLEGLWDWETTLEQRLAVRQLFRAVFERSAALTAIVVVCLCQKTGLLQPAMGGLTVAIGGDLYEKSPFFRSALSKYIGVLVPEEIEKLIHFYSTDDAVKKGAGIITVVMEGSD